MSQIYKIHALKTQLNNDDALILKIGVPNEYIPTDKEVIAALLQYYFSIDPSFPYPLIVDPMNPFIERVLGRAKSLNDTTLEGGVLIGNKLGDNLQGIPLNFSIDETPQVLKIMPLSAAEKDSVLSEHYTFTSDSNVDLNDAYSLLKDFINSPIKQLEDAGYSQASLTDDAIILYSDFALVLNPEPV